MDLSPEQREIGRENYYRAVTSHNKMTRRGFLQNVAAAGVVSTAGLGGMYFGYNKPNNPVRVGVIGTGDEGNILIGALNPDYVQVVAIADIRPSSIHRAFHGDWGGSNPQRTHSLRPGLMQIYDWKTKDEARKHVKVYDEDYNDLIKDDDVEAVIIALPLHLHAKASVAAMQNGKHVLTEKLMAHNVAQCKVMARVAEKTDKYLATGHQRHYSVLYDNAVHLIKWGLLGQLHYIRAQWHRGNMPGRDSWAPPLPGGEVSLETGKQIDIIGSQLNKLIAKKTSMEKALAAGRSINKDDYELVSSQVKQWTAWDADKTVPAKDHNYVEIEDFYPNGVDRTALEELIRWRIWDRTGGGLMAELGSHQLDAASIFISALTEQKVQPLSVHAIGGRHIFPNDRDAEDHVYCMFEFPAPDYEPGFDPGYKDKVIGYPDPKAGIPGYSEKHDEKKIVVTYSSINGNGFGGYGEIVMGTKGTLVLEKEQEVMLYKSGSASTKVGVKEEDGGLVLDTQESGEMGPSKSAEETGPVSRGYAEEIEHWAWCIRNQAPENQPRCNPKVALGDAVLALTAKLAIRNANEGKDAGGFIRFKEEWFDPNSDEVPEGISVNSEISELKANLPLS